MYCEGKLCQIFFIIKEEQEVTWLLLGVSGGVRQGNTITFITTETVVCIHTTFTTLDGIVRGCHNSPKSSIQLTFMVTVFIFLLFKKTEGLFKMKLHTQKQS